MQHVQIHGRHKTIGLCEIDTHKLTYNYAHAIMESKREKEVLQMRKTVNINEKNYEALRVYAIENSVTVTTIINQAIEHYLLGKVMFDSVKELIETRLSKLNLQSINVGTSDEKKNT